MTKIVKEPFSPARRYIDTGKFWLERWQALLDMVSLILLKGQS